MPLGNREIVQKLFIDLLSNGNPAVAEEIMAVNHVNHDLGRRGADLPALGRFTEMRLG